MSIQELINELKQCPADADVTLNGMTIDRVAIWPGNEVVIESEGI